MRCLTHVLQGWFLAPGTWAPFQYPMRRLILRSRAVLNPAIGSLDHHVALKYDRLVGNSAAEGPVKFQCDRTIMHINPAAWGFTDILRLFKYWNRDQAPLKKPKAYH